MIELFSNQRTFSFLCKDTTRLVGALIHTARTGIHQVFALAILLPLLIDLLLFMLAVNLNELVEHLVCCALGDMKCERQHIEWILFDRSVILLHAEEKGELIRQVIISLHFGIDAPLVG